MNLYSWLDAERMLASKTQNFSLYPGGIADIRIYSEVIEIDLIGDDETVAFDFVKEIFGNDWQSDTQKIELAYGPQSTIDVEVILQCEEQAKRSPKPLWKDLGYDEAKPVLPKAPEPFSGKCKIAAFHSFKGGVGRTTSLLTWFKALQVNFHRPDNDNKRKKLKVLLVDADLEAPGLTYLFKGSDKPDVSWIQFLEASHYPAVDESAMISAFAQEIDRYTKSDVGFEYCLLPAFSDSKKDSETKAAMAQLMNISVRPEHLARTHEQPWRCTDMLQKLGNQLQADLILIDLRAGLSELSSPLLFDPRVERFVVTTLAEQAIMGTEFILNRLASLANNQDWRNSFGDKTLDPRVITTFVNEEFKKTDQYKTGLERLTAAYMPDKYAEDNANATDGLEIIEGEFSSQLLNLGALDSALSVIENASPLLNEGLNWARDFFDNDNQLSSEILEEDDGAASRLYDLSSQLVYAELGETDKLLLTTPLRNLAQRHSNTLPQVVSIGAKGSGKTFNYIQLCRRGSWKRFLEEAEVSPPPELSDQLSDTFVLPYIHSDNTDGDANNAINDARRAFYTKAGVQDEFKQSKFSSTKDQALQDKATDWLSFWEQGIIALHGLGNSIADFENLNEEMKNQGLQTIVVIDGIEDLFPNVGDSPEETQAVKKLLELPNRLREIRNCVIGIVIFIREDYVEAVTTQNLGQFVERYEPFRLLWDAEAFLRLVYWSCEQAGLIFAQKPVTSLTTREISVKLHGLWGLKLGSPSSREAYSVRWVYAALCDLKGRLQARDVVRFLKYASEKTRDSSNTAQWTDRVLIPQAMRNAMNECSSEKVKEAQKELAVLKDWIKKLADIDAEKKTIPFSAKAINATMEQLEKLMEYGIVYEDKKIKEPHRYYLPESYRQGLGFTMSKGGRPKVQAMLKDSLGKIPVDP